jgi:hypothetical protein
VTIQDVGSIGELIAAIATIATLAYLAIQIRGNTIAMKAEARRGARVDAAAITRLVAANDETAEILNRGLADPKSLNATEKLRFQMIISEMIFAPLETAEKEWRMGTTDGEELNALGSHIAPLISTPGAQWFWERHRSEYPAGLQEFVDPLMAAAQQSAEADSAQS